MKIKKHGLLTNALRKALRKNKDDDEMMSSLALASKSLDEDDLFFVTGGAQYDASPEDMHNLVGVDSVSSSATQSAIISLMSSGGQTFEVMGGSTDVGQSSQPIDTNGGTNLDLQNTDFSVYVAQFDQPAGVDLTNPDGLNLTNSDGLDLNHQVSDNNSITLDDGQVSVSTGDGNDLFALRDEVKGRFDSGSGDNDLILNQSANESAEISVDAGDGFDIMTLFGQSRMQHKFSFNGKSFHMQ